MSLQSNLLTRKSSVAIWGSGAVGGTTAAFYARAGVHVFAYDPNPTVVDSISRGILRIPSPEDQLGFSIGPLLARGLIEPTTDVTRILNNPKVKVHFVAVPTEKDGEPWGGALEEVANRLTQKSRAGPPELIIVESTLAPGYGRRYMLDILEAGGRHTGRDFHFAVAPRRDWFTSKERNLQSLPRVVGATDDVALRTAMEVLSIVCKELVPVSSYCVAELVKPLENAFRAINIALVDEVARAFSHLNVREAIEAAATKWNFLAHYPGAGIGGYCIPIAPKYLLAGVNGNSLKLQLVNSVSKSISEHTRYVADALHNASKGGTIILLGLAYKEETRIHACSPTLEIADRLLECGVDVRIHDPLYSAEEIKSITGAEPATYPDDLRSSTAIAVLVGHRLYRSFSERDVKFCLRPGTAILDIEGTWQKLEPVFMKCKMLYRRLGTEKWTEFA